ncbi:MAG TPA: AAA family ATPase, partial [Polyangiaceae bacterium]|nr:AAA family ATPase [Polyangiaceae bacterium]
MTRPDRSESELALLRKAMAQLAEARRERATTVHLLAAVAERPGPAAELLLQRGLDRETILKAGRTFDEDSPDGTSRVLSGARDVARRARGPVSTDHGERGAARISPDSRLVHVEPSALHVLVALLADRRSAAHRSLELAGVDVARLRTVALSHALGIVATRSERPERSMAVDRGAPKTPRGSVVSLLPRPAPPSDRPSAPPESDRGPAKRVALMPKIEPAPHGRARPASEPPGRARAAENDSDRKSHEPRRSRPRPAGPAHAVPRATDGALDAHAFPTLASLAAPLAFAGDLPVGRDAEIDRVLEIFAKHRSNTPCLVGPSGVGKTATARGVAAALSGEGKTLVELSVASLVASSGARGALGEKLAQAFDEVRRAQGRVAVWIDDVDELLAHDEATLELKVQLSKGGVPLLFAATTEGFRRAIESDTQLARRIAAVELEEP